MVYFLVSNPFLISFWWCRAISGQKYGWYCIYWSPQRLAHLSLPWRDSSRNVWEGWSFFHHIRTCGTTGKWGLKGGVTLAQFQDHNVCDICGAGTLSPVLLGFCWGHSSLHNLPVPTVEGLHCSCFPPTKPLGGGGGQGNPSCVSTTLASASAQGTEKTPLSYSPKHLNERNIHVSKIRDKAALQTTACEKGILPSEKP